MIMNHFWSRFRILMSLRKRNANPNRKKMETNSLRKIIPVGRKDWLAYLYRTNVNPQNTMARITLT
jgi:hypothetical protein